MKTELLVLLISIPWAVMLAVIINWIIKKMGEREKILEKIESINNRLNDIYNQLVFHGVLDKSKEKK